MLVYNKHLLFNIYGMSVKVNDDYYLCVINLLLVTS